MNDIARVPLVFIPFAKLLKAKQLAIIIRFSYSNRGLSLFRLAAVLTIFIHVLEWRWVFVEQFSFGIETGCRTRQSLLLHIHPDFIVFISVLSKDMMNKNRLPFLRAQINVCKKSKTAQKNVYFHIIQSFWGSQILDVSLVL